MSRGSEFKRLEREWERAKFMADMIDKIRREDAGKIVSCIDSMELQMMGIKP